MSTLQTFLLVFQAIVSITLIGFILIQHGKGADAGAAFGSGASGTVFGSQGTSNFFSKATTVLAVLFLGNSLLLGYLAANTSSEPASLLEGETSSVMMEEAVPQQPAENAEKPGEQQAADSTTEEVPLQPQDDQGQGSGGDVPLVPQQ